MKRTLTRLLAVLLLLPVLSSCGGQSGSVSSSPPDRSPVYGDQLIKETCALSGDFTGEWGETISYSYHVPSLADDTPDALAINQKLQKELGIPAQEAMDSMDEGALPMVERISWHSFWHGSLLSLVVETSVDPPVMDYTVVNYDFASGRSVSNRELLEYAGVTADGFDAAIRRAAAQAYDGGIPVEWIDMRASTLSRQNLDLDNLSLFLNQDGGLSAVVPLHTLAAYGTADTILTLDLSSPADLDKTVTCGFVTASMENGTVWLSFQETEDSCLYLGEDIRYDVGYPVQGLYGTYTDMTLDVLGQNFFPYLFLVDQNGEVSFCDVMLCAQYDGGFYAAGPFQTTSPTISFESGMSANEDASCPTVFALDSEGGRMDLSQQVASIQDLVPYYMDGSTWVTPDGRDCMVYTQDKELVFIIARGEKPDWYQGTLAYAGLTENGMIFAYSVWPDPDNHNTIEESYRGMIAIRPAQANGADSELLLELELLDGSFPMKLSENGTLTLVQSWG